VDYVKQFPHWILVTVRLGDASENSTGHRGEKIDLGRFLSPAGFRMIDAMPQDITFASESFITQVLTPLHQHRISLSQDAAPRTLSLHFDNSRCDTAPSVAAEMAKLRSKRLPHPVYSHD
jgi:hypothetical protein